MAKRSTTSPLAAFDWLEDTGLFVKPVALRDWDEVARQLRICARLSDLFRERLAAWVREHWAETFSSNRDAAAGRRGVEVLLKEVAGCPRILDVDFDYDDPDAVESNVPEIVTLEVGLGGGRQRPKEDIERQIQALFAKAKLKPDEVDRIRRRLTLKMEDGLRSDGMHRAERRAAARELALELKLDLEFLTLVLEDRRLYLTPRAGRIGYLKVEPDDDWPRWRPVPEAQKLMGAVADLWRGECRTYQRLAEELNARGFTTLTGKAFTKASVIKVLIAERLVAGSDPPWLAK